MFNLGDRVRRIKPAPALSYTCYKLGAEGTVIGLKSSLIQIKFDNCNCDIPANQGFHDIEEEKIEIIKSKINPIIYQPKTVATSCIYSNNGLPVAEVDPISVQIDYKYDQPFNTMEDAARKQVISTTKRTLREIPICNFTGKPVNITTEIVNVDGVCVVRAVLFCPHCVSNKKEDDLDLPF